MKVSFPAMRGMMGNRPYFSCQMQLSVIPKMFTFNDWAEFSPEDREQRQLTKKRIPEIAKYILDNEEGYLFSAITASHKCQVKFTPFADQKDIGTLEVDLANANFVINDGQHRCAAIAYALKENPSLGEESICVLLFEHENLARVQQMFSDLNRYVQKTAKSLDILYDHRDPLADVTKSVCDAVEAFCELVEKESISMPTRSSKLFTLSALYDANKELFAEHKYDTDNANRADLIDLAVSFWNEVANNMPDWRRVRDRELLALNLRQERISSHSVIMRALGSVGADLMKHSPNDWRERLKGLLDVDWSKRNKDWEGICIVANSVVSNRQARQATKAYLKRHLKLELTEAEHRSLPREILSA